MTSLLCYFIPLLAIAVALDLFLVTGLQRFRKLKKESTDQEGILKTSNWELLKQAFGVKRKSTANSKPFWRWRKNLQRDEAHQEAKSKPEIGTVQTSTNGKKSHEAVQGQVSFSVKPGTKVQIT